MIDTGGGGFQGSSSASQTANDDVKFGGNIRVSGIQGTAFDPFTMSQGGGAQSVPPWAWMAAAAVVAYVVVRRV